MKIKKFFSRRVTSLLLVCLMVLTMFPTGALAADVTDENQEVVTEAPYSYEEKVAMLNEDETSTEEGHLIWLLDEHGILHIDGHGCISAFTSADDQPWKYQRDHIYAVMFDYEEQGCVESYDYWFDGCANLSEENILDYETCISLSDISVYTSSNCGVSNCTCTGTCSSTYSNYRTAENADSYHIMTVYCAGCNQTDGIVVTGSHSYSGNTCTLCGYTKSCSHSSYTTSWITSCDWVRYCKSCGEELSSGTTHGPYTYGDWYYYSSTYHRRSYTCSYGDSGTYYESERHSTTTSCSKYSSTQHSVSSYCATCDSTVGSTTYESHDFSYGNWESYSSTQHRRTKTCTDCGYSTYEYASHSLSYGSWTSADDSQHCRSVSCSCGYSTTEYADHELTYGDWEINEGSDYSNTHKRSVSCSCGYSAIEYEAHSCYGVSDWEYADATYHKRSEECECGYPRILYTYHSYSTTKESISATEHEVIKICSYCGHSTSSTETHSFSYGSWASCSDIQHQRTVSCDCGYSTTEYGDHFDTDNDNYCDECSYLMSRFSVTVPANLNLTISKDGEVYSATSAEIVNNSTAAVSVTSIVVSTENGWALVPYSTNMANEKVDSKRIGFCVNGAESVNSGSSETLDLTGDWTIPVAESLALNYDAVVSAVSDPVSEQVLTIVFVIDWAV